MADNKAKAQEAKARGNTALSAKDFATAIKEYSTAIELDPSDHVFYSNRSAAFLQNGDAMQALSDAEQCVSLKPDWAKGHSRLGAASVACGDLEGAVRAYSKQVELEPANQAAKDDLADAKGRLDRQRARASAGGPGGMPPGGDPFGPSMIARLAANPKFASYLADESFVKKLKKITDAKSQADRTAALTEALGAGIPGGAGMGGGAEGGGDPRLFEVLMYLMGVGGGAGGMPGGPGMDEDDDDEDDGAMAGMMGAMPGGAKAGGMSAADRYEAAARARAMAEEESEKRAKEAKAAAERKAKEEAERAAKEAEANMSEEDKAKLQKKKDAQKKKEEGNAFYKSRSFDQAIACYDEAYALDDEEIMFLVNKGAALFEQGKLDECVAVCKKAVERGSEVMAPYASRAKAWARIGNAEAKRGDLGKAIEAYESSLLESHTDDVFEKLKKAKADKKRKEADEYKDPVKGAEAKELGNEAFKASDFAMAIKHYSEAIKRDPTNPGYYANRSAARLKVMNPTEALEDAEASLKLDPNFVRGHCKKGACHFATKEFHKALTCYQKALELDKDSEEAKEGLRKTVAKINETSASGAPDEERLRRAMADPEIQACLRDPLVSSALEDMQRDPAAARRVLSDPSVAPKIQKLIAAGVIGVR